MATGVVLVGLGSLLNIGVYGRAATTAGATPLHLAALAGAAESVVTLLKHGADASIGDDR